MSRIHFKYTKYLNIKISSECAKWNIGWLDFKDTVWEAKLITVCGAVGTEKMVSGPSSADWTTKFRGNIFQQSYIYNYESSRYQLWLILNIHTMVNTLRGIF